MGYEAVTGRLPGRRPAPLPRHRGRRPGRGRPEAARQGRGRRSPPRRPGSGPATTRRSRTGSTCAYCPFRAICPSSVAHVTERLAAIRAITFDFGNTLVPVGRAALRRVVELHRRGGLRPLAAIRPRCVPRGWAEERERQFREEVPQFREVDLAERLVRVLARLRGMPPPAADERWDQAAAARRSRAGRDRPGRSSRTAAPSSTRLPPTPGVGRAARGGWRAGATLAILSNWPLAATIDRYAEAHGWLPSPPGDRRQPAGRDDQAASGDLRGGARGARRPGSGGDPPRRGRLGGGRRRGRAHAGWRTAWLAIAPARLAAARRASATARSSRTSSPRSSTSSSRTSRRSRLDGRHARRPRAIGHSPHWRRPARGASMHRSPVGGEDGSLSGTEDEIADGPRPDRQSRTRHAAAAIDRGRSSCSSSTTSR